MPARGPRRGSRRPATRTTAASWPRWPTRCAAPENPKTLRYRDFVEKGYVIAGSPATVRDRLKEEVIKGLRVGNLMVLLQIGSMPHELTLENIDLFAREGAARSARHRGTTRAG